MDLLVIRHAIAQDGEKWAKTGEPDERRPLTKKGRKKMRRVAKGLHRLVPDLDLLATSPLTRAVQTAEIVGKRYGELAVVVLNDLQPERPFTALLEWLRRLDDVDVAAIVGHEPHLSGFVSWVLSGTQGSQLELKKGAACMVSFPQQLEAGAARLTWSLTPAQLRAIARV
jgi:phosphohistidine phosphatase